MVISLDLTISFDSIFKKFVSKFATKIRKTPTFDGLPFKPVAMAVLHVGVDFDGPVYTEKSVTRTDELFVGPARLLQWLETQLGLSGYPQNTDYLRIELYRQALGQHLETHAVTPFYARSFEADRFATAVALLAWRDELLLAGWSFEVTATAPPRLQTLAAVEMLFANKIADPGNGPLAMGVADRFVQVIKLLKIRTIPELELRLYEPLILQKPEIQRFIHVCLAKNVPVKEVDIFCAAAPASNLGQFQRRMLPAGKNQETAKIPATDDASLLILRSRRDSDAAVYVSQILRLNPTLKPVFLVPEMSLQLEENLVLEGFPAMGILSASLARPSLQVLKLAPAFLWEPVDVYKIMEFVTLPVKPLDPDLALVIARVLAQQPGLFSDTWFAAVYGYLEQIEVADAVREQYEFWFNRRRYRSDTTAPKRDAIVIYNYLFQWARKAFEDNDDKNTSLLVLAEQARRIRDLLEALPEQRLSFLELERIVRTIYEPSPMQIAAAETGSFSFVHRPGALAACAESVVWWNCLFENSAPPPEKWQTAERQWLADQDIQLRSPVQESQITLYRQRRLLLQTARQLILVVPAQMNGMEAVPNLLLGDVEAAFDDCKRFTYDLDTATDRERLNNMLQQPMGEMLPVKTNVRPKPHLRFKRHDLLMVSEYETPTNLENLFYYPHAWFFRQKLKLYPLNLLSITGETRLLGNLAHRFFEKLLQEDFLQLDKTRLTDWIYMQANMLLEKEGATLLLYGREPERLAFLNHVRNAAWSLITLLRSNNWLVVHTEHALEGFFGGIPLRGKADLVLRRGDELAIVDLKWSGATMRKELIKNGEDLQLVLYGHLLPPPEQWPHTAYFILKEGKMIGRNQEAFKEAIVAGQNDDHKAVCDLIFGRMEKTFAWRLDQVGRGVLEMRNARTAAELEALYEEEPMFDRLEMKVKDAPWDDYRGITGG